ncbi:hypothetical protein HDU85_005255 [Gaertneriomyces sp. JEL0708]|nr:hypothetical protein HDU85_005255 [Gaertneriomyces sp. JEL0708]
MPAPKNPSHAGSGGYPYEEATPTLAVEREDPDQIAQFDKEFKDEAETGEHPNDFGTGAKFGFASDNYPNEKHSDISRKGGENSGPSRTKPTPNPHGNLE